MKNIGASIVSDRKDVDWNKVAQIRSAPSLQQTMEFLEDGPKAASEINEEMGVKRPTVSAYFRRLREKDLIECLTPERRKVRLYGLTEEGKEVLKKARP